MTIREAHTRPETGKFVGTVPQGVGKTTYLLNGVEVHTFSGEPPEQFDTRITVSAREPRWSGPDVIKVWRRGRIPGRRGVTRTFTGVDEIEGANIRFRRNQGRVYGGPVDIRLTSVPNRLQRKAANAAAKAQQ